MGTSRASGFITLGSTVLGGAVTLWAAYWIYAARTKGVHVWSAPTWILIGCGAVGAALAVYGLARSGAAEPPPTMTQRGGSGSTNIQSGRDSIVNRRKDEDDSA